MRRKINFSITSLEAIAERLDNVKWKSDGGLTARCPAHDDRRNSLSVKVGENGRPIFYCHAGCDYDEIVDAIGVSSKSALVPKKPRQENAQAENGLKRVAFVSSDIPEPDFEEILGRKPLAVYTYRNPQDRVIGYVVRMKGKDGKQFFQIMNRPGFAGGHLV